MQYGPTTLAGVVFREIVSTCTHVRARVRVTAESFSERATNRSVIGFILRPFHVSDLFFRPTDNYVCGGWGLVSCPACIINHVRTLDPS